MVLISALSAGQHPSSLSHNEDRKKALRGSLFDMLRRDLGHKCLYQPLIELGT